MNELYCSACGLRIDILVFEDENCPFCAGEIKLTSPDQIDLFEEESVLPFSVLPLSNFTHLKQMSISNTESSLEEQKSDDSTPIDLSDPENYELGFDIIKGGGV